VRQLLVYCLGKREGDWPCHHSGKLPIDRFQAEEVLSDIERLPALNERHDHSRSLSSEELSFTSNVDISKLQRGRSMRTILLGLLAVASIANGPASAQVIVDTPVGGVRVGRDRDYDRYRYSDYDSPRYRSYARDCRTITIRRDDGSVRRIRRCD
jgi:hypothetical protein